MVIFPVIIYLSVPLLVASTVNAASRAEYDAAMEPFECAYRKARLANQNLQSRLDWHYKQLEQEIDSGEMDEEDIELDRKEFKQLAERVAAEMEANIKERDEFAKKFWQSNPNLPDEYTSDFERETLNKTLTLYENPTLSALSERDGGDLLTGYVVWASARMLAKYLEVSTLRGPWIPGKIVLDIGAGTGFLSIVAACLGGDVVAADLPQMLPFIQRNIDLNLKQIEGTGGKIRTQSLRWGDAEDIKSLPKPDIILLSGVIYNEELVEPLVSTVVSVSDENTILIVCQDKWTEGRWSTSSWDAFYSRAIKYFDLSPIEYNSVSPSGQVGYSDVWLMRGNFRREIALLQ